MKYEPLLHVVLYQPEIPPNTGNVIRLCANTGTQLHLIKPLGFALSDPLLRRAGLDYHEYARLHEHDSLPACLAQIQPPHLYALSTRGQRSLYTVRFEPGDALLFGPETRGLPDTLLAQLPCEHILRLPMRPDNRSINLSNAVAVSVYEAWRQHQFAGGA